jgi:putative hemolysin
VALRDSLELGRSFVAPAYQRRSPVLALLWQALARFVTRTPRVRHLWGPASVSADYGDLGWHIIVSFLRTHGFLHPLSEDVQAAQPIRLRSTPVVERLVQQSSGDLASLNALLREINSSARGMPVLLERYLALGAKVLGFNVDRAFGGSLDVLLWVDLVEVPHARLCRFMGPETARRYLTQQRLRTGHRPMGAPALPGDMDFHSLGETCE